MKFTISVVIPVYNGEKFIGRAIESVLSQTYPVHEIIVINDGSKDKTLSVLKAYEGQIRYKTIENGGASKARNEGMAMATGELIAFLDADDIWHTEKLEKQAALFEKYPEVGFNCCNYKLYDAWLEQEVDHFRVLDRYRVKYNEPMSSDVLKLLLALNFVGTCSTVMVRKSVLDQVGVFNTAYKQAEDFELWLRCAMVTRFVIMSETLVEKKTHSSNLTNNQIEMNSFHKMVLEDFMREHGEFLKKNNLYKDMLAALSVINYKLGDLSFNSGDLKKSRQFYWQSFACERSLKTFMRLSVGMSKKTVRLMSFGIISRNTAKKLRLKTAVTAGSSREVQSPV